LLGPDAPDLPEIRRFAERAVVFESAVSPSPWTLPAHASLMTGLYPDRHGATHRWNTLAGDIPTLAGRLAGAGYVTAGFTDGIYVSRRYGMANGFHVFNSWRHPESPRIVPELPRSGTPTHIAGEELFDRGVAFLDRRDGDGPFFLFLHTFMVHDYFRVHPWALETLPPYQGDDPDRYLACVTGRTACSGADWDRLRRLYRAELPRLDVGIGRLLAALDRNGMTDTTAVFLTSDHGEGFAPDLGRIHHGGRLHDDVIGIPLLVAGPGISGGATIAPASLVDIMPTVLELCGLAAEPEIDGVSLTPVLIGGSAPAARTLFAMEHCFWWKDRVRMSVPEAPAAPLMSAAIRGHRRYLRDWQSVEVFDLESDHRQVNDLGPAAPFASELAEQLGSRDGHRVVGPPVTRDRDLEEKLRALGYMR
jgi:arylsulfatase A-like enzyme